MNAIRARLAALAASLIVTALAAHGVWEASPETAGVIERWLALTLELLLVLGYAVLQRRMRREVPGREVPLGTVPAAPSPVHGSDSHTAR